MTAQQTRVRIFCVDIAPPIIARNIDAALLRAHSLRRICAHYNGLQICANSTHASTHASNLRKKNLRAKKIFAKKVRARIRTRDFYSEVRYSNHSATLTSVRKGQVNSVYKHSSAISAQNWRNFAHASTHAPNSRFCAKSANS